MTINEQACPKCNAPMSKGKRYWDEWARNEYTTTYFHCEPCEQWYEETFLDQFCGPDTVTLAPVSKATMEDRLAENS